MLCFRLILILATQGLASALQLEMLESLNLRNLNLTRLHRFRLISTKDYLADLDKISSPDVFLEKFLSFSPLNARFPVLPALTSLDISGNRLTGGLEVNAETSWLRDLNGKC